MLLAKWNSFFRLMTFPFKICRQQHILGKIWVYFSKTSIFMPFWFLPRGALCSTIFHLSVFERSSYRLAFQNALKMTWYLQIFPILMQRTRSSKVALISWSYQNPQMILKISCVITWKAQNFRLHLLESFGFC